MLIDYKKGDGLVPVIIQDDTTLQVLMLGYMNEEAYETTVRLGRVTFYSRSKKRLWTKGESSGNHLVVKDIKVDCDQDTLLIQATPSGPTCHKGRYSCFADRTIKGTLYHLEKTIDKRISNLSDNSYTANLYQRGINKVAQKVGEEAVELVIEAKDNNDDLFIEEAADLLYHTLILLRAKGKSLADVERQLKEREK